MDLEKEFKFSRKCLGLRFSEQATLGASDLTLFQMVIMTSFIQ